MICLPNLKQFARTVINNVDEQPQRTPQSETPTATRVYAPRPRRHINIRLAERVQSSKQNYPLETLKDIKNRRMHLFKKPVRGSCEARHKRTSTDARNKSQQTAPKQKRAALVRPRPVDKRNGALAVVVLDTSPKLTTPLTTFRSIAAKPKVTPLSQVLILPSGEQILHPVDGGAVLVPVDGGRLTTPRPIQPMTEETRQHMDYMREYMRANPLTGSVGIISSIGEPIKANPRKSKVLLNSTEIWR